VLEQHETLFRSVVPDRNRTHGTVWPLAVELMVSGGRSREGVHDRVSPPRWRVAPGGAMLAG
jgi:hypothetical protein